MRLFAAIDIPDTIRDNIASVASSLDIGRIRLVYPTNIHITILFFGEVAPDYIGTLTESLNEIRQEPFKVSLRGLGSFGPADRVIFANVDTGRRDFIDLYVKVRRSAQELKIGLEQTRFAPHATIARTGEKLSSIAIDNLCEKYESYNFGSFDATLMSLKSSTATEEGHIYKTLAEFDFK